MSSYRGRLIFPKLAEIARLDTAAVEAAGDYDHVFGEIRASNENRPGASRSVPRAEVLARAQAQVETDSFQRIMMGGLGQVPNSRMVLVFLASELEELGFVDATTRKPIFKPTDRLAAVYELDGTTLILRVEEDPGLFATHVQPTGFGFGAGGYNLVEVTFEARPDGIVNGGGVAG